MTSSSSSSRKALSKIACNRLQKKQLPAGFKHKVSDNLQRRSLTERKNRQDYRNHIMRIIRDIQITVVNAGN
ncbi:unnamed protein product [Urochloa humidicola]